MELRRIYFSHNANGEGYNAGKRVYSDEETQHTRKDSEATGENDGGPGNGAGAAGNAGNAGGLGGGNTGGMQGTHLASDIKGNEPSKEKE